MAEKVSLTAAKVWVMCSSRARDKLNNSVVDPMARCPDEAGHAKVWTRQEELDEFLSK